jgi:pimeloyl-ACP methyl ester carboxylesterase
MFGCAGLPFRHIPVPVWPAIETLWKVLVHRPELAAGLAHLGLAIPGVSLRVLRTIRFIGTTTSRPVFLHDVSNVASADHRAYLRTMVALAAHDASDVLSTVEVPALVIGGGHDTLTPAVAARRMAARMPHAECVLLPNASHYGLIEDEPVNELIDRFLARAG